MNKFRFLKVFGERNTGTNFLNKMANDSTFGMIMLQHGKNDGIKDEGKSFPKHLRQVVRERLTDLRRSNEFPENFGWKHSYVDTDMLRCSPRFDETIFLMVVRNPFYFLSSLYRRPYNLLPNKWESKSEFIRSKILLNQRDNIPNRATVGSPVELWSLKTQSYVAAASTLSNSAIFRYEDLVDNPNILIAALDKFGISVKDSAEPPIDSVKGDDLKFQDYQRISSEYDPTQDFTANDIDYVINKIDRDLSLALGYLKENGNLI